ncbi:PKHA2 protein, partial [Nothocercus nigrocapillus]|nr:PKHA2 protein [Nothocercus nigrocapillus]
MPYLDRHNRICGFLDIEENESCGKFLRRYFILDTQANCLQWYMDNPQVGAARGAAESGTAGLSVRTEGVPLPKLPSPPPRLPSGSCPGTRTAAAIAENAILENIGRAGGDFTRRPARRGKRDARRSRAGKGKGREPLPVLELPLRALQNLAMGAGAVGSLQLTYISKVKPGPRSASSGNCGALGMRAALRKSWKRRYFVLDEFSISYFKCEQVSGPRGRLPRAPGAAGRAAVLSPQDKEPLRSILLKDVCKTHECLVKSGDLLMRDNLFEIVTSSRTFYIQADSPEDMHSWIRAISAAAQALKTRPREISFMRSASVVKPSGSGLPSSSSPSLSPLRALEERKALGEPPSAWQPWTPVPQAPRAEELLGEPVFLAGSAERGQRARHRSEPQHAKEKPFAFDLDDESIRTSDV